MCSIKAIFRWAVCHIASSPDKPAVAIGQPFIVAFGAALSVVCLHGYYMLAWMMTTSILNLSSSKAKVCETFALYHWNSAAHIIQKSCKMAFLPDQRPGIQICSEHHRNPVDCCLGSWATWSNSEVDPTLKLTCLEQELDQTTSRVNVILQPRQTEVKLQLSPLFLLPSKYTHSRVIKYKHQVGKYNIFFMLWVTGQLLQGTSAYTQTRRNKLIWLCS